VEERKRRCWAQAPHLRTEGISSPTAFTKRLTHWTGQSTLGISRPVFPCFCIINNFLKPVRSSLLVHPFREFHEGGPKKKVFWLQPAKWRKEESFSLPVYVSRRWEDASWKCSVSGRDTLFLNWPEGQLHRLEFHNGKGTSTPFAVAQ